LKWLPEKNGPRTEWNRPARAAHPQGSNVSDEIAARERRYSYLLIH
jgi:hypothetical protein